MAATAEPARNRRCLSWTSVRDPDQRWWEKCGRRCGSSHAMAEARRLRVSSSDENNKDASSLCLSPQQFIEAHPLSSAAAVDDDARCVSLQNDPVDGIFQPTTQRQNGEKSRRHDPSFKQDYEISRGRQLSATQQPSGQVPKIAATNPTAVPTGANHAERVLNLLHLFVFIFSSPWVAPANRPRRVPALRLPPYSHRAVPRYSCCIFCCRAFRPTAAGSFSPSPSRPPLLLSIALVLIVALFWIARLGRRPTSINTPPLYCALIVALPSSAAAPAAQPSRVRSLRLPTQPFSTSCYASTRRGPDARVHTRPLTTTRSAHTCSSPKTIPPRRPCTTTDPTFDSRDPYACRLAGRDPPSKSS